MDRVPAIYDFEVKTIKGELIKLEEFREKVLLIVNTASKCGFVKQFAELQQLYQDYGNKGFVVLGFPANNFMNQEPNSDAEIEELVQTKYAVTFPMFSKISVRGKDIHPLYKFLTDPDSNPNYKGKVTWNFNKFLISRNGEVISRFPSKTNPLDKKVVEAIENALG
jgi:glutathione peroxidase-family protein